MMVASRLRLFGRNHAGDNTAKIEDLNLERQRVTFSANRGAF